jgi:membrane-associated protease RseP (regulator of RpoE activity)
MMELARSFSAEGARPRHSLLFMAFSGEERGLLGSANYVGSPLIPLDRTVAMINLDMIGRVSRNRLYIGGVGTSSQFRQWLQEANQGFGFQLDYSDSGYGASDHMSFARREVPVLFFFSGLHADYHKPTDTWEKQLPVETAKVLEMVSRVVNRIDEANDRLQFVRVQRQQQPRDHGEAASEQTGDPGPGYGAYFGSIPDFGEVERGVKFADVRDGSPAAQASLRPGDTLIQFDGKEVRNLYDFTDYLRAKRPGDEVPVVVLRDGQEIRATVKLGSRQ